MKQSNVYTLLKVYLVCIATLAIAVGLVTILSCNKNTVSATGKAIASSTPPTHDKPYTYTSNVNKSVGILVEDAYGNWTPLNNHKNGSRTLSTCNNDSWAVALIYRGYSNDDICFSGPSGASGLRQSWDLYLPEGISIVNDSTCVARIKIGPLGFFTAPTGTGFRTTPYQYYYVETVDIDGLGTMMKKWRILSHATPFSEGDYCSNFTLTPTFKLKTDCPDLTTIQPVLTTDYMDLNSLSIPDLLAYNRSTTTQKRIEFVPNLPICGNGCHGYWKWCTNYNIQTKLTTSTIWSATIDWYSNVITSFTISAGSGSGTYQFRYKGLVRGTTGNGAWSEWIQPATTVFIP
ncbi:MAG: hypothetical protein WC756_16270 [Taibaiella sp.]|jgi:hypothetical protein